VEVTEEGIDNVIDNSDCMGLGLDDRCKHAVRHAAAQEKAVVFAYVALPLALTYCCPATGANLLLPDASRGAGISCARSISFLSPLKRSGRGCKRLLKCALRP
jgi:hypothetical protein